MTWAKRFIRDFFVPGMDVLELGARDINGSVRPLFKGASSYTGVDMQNGKGVDAVLDAHELDKHFERRDIILAFDMLEHDAAPWTTVEAARRALKRGGLFAVAVPDFSFEPHCPPDYWRFSPDGLRALLRGFELHRFTTITRGVAAVGVKP